MPVHDRTSFEGLYTGQPRWEIGRPQKALLDIADKISGTILDSGCGTGENALFFAEGWVIESIEQSRYEVRPDSNDVSFKDGGPKAWFVVVKREDE